MVKRLLRSFHEEAKDYFVQKREREAKETIRSLRDLGFISPIHTIANTSITGSDLGFISPILTLTWFGRFLTENASAIQKELEDEHHVTKRELLEVQGKLKVALMLHKTITAVDQAKAHAVQNVMFKHLIYGWRHAQSAELAEIRAMKATAMAESALYEVEKQAEEDLKALEKEKTDIIEKSAEEKQNDRLRRALQTLIFNINFSSETGALEVRCFRFMVSLWRSRVAREKEQSILKEAFLHKLAKKEDQIMVLNKEHETALEVAERDAVAREEACREDARETITKLEHEVVNLEELGKNMVETAQNTANEKVEAFKLQAEEKEKFLGFKLTKANDEIKKLETDIVILNTKQLHRQACFRIRHFRTVQELMLFQHLSCKLSVESWLRQYDYEKEITERTSWTRLKTWKGISDTNKCRKWWLLKVSSYLSMNIKLEKHMNEMRALKEEAAAAANEARNEIAMLEDTNEDLEYIIQDLQDEVKDLAMKLDATSRSTALTISVKEQGMDELCIDGIPMAGMDLIASKGETAKKTRVRRPMVKPKPPGRAAVRTGFEEALEKARKMAEKLLDRRDMEGLARPVCEADAGAIIRQAEILEEKGEEKYTIYHETGADDKRAKRKIDRHCKDVYNIMRGLGDGRLGDFPRECGRCIHEINHEQNENPYIIHFVK